MFVKICGLTTPEEAASIGDLQPDAIGLNFYLRSPRGLTGEKAAEIAAETPGNVQKIGVFVDQTPAEINKLAEQATLDVVQLHGDYEPEDVLQLDSRPFIWVYRLGAEGLAPLKAACERFTKLERLPLACLIDARVPGLYGGSGHTVDWPALATNYDTETLPPLLLAGGLHAENVAEAISTVRPWGVDVASGVESDGRKDLDKCRRFLTNARNALS